MPMPDVPLVSRAGAGLLPLLDFAVFEIAEDASFHLGQPPEWLGNFPAKALSACTADDLTKVFPYLEAFFREAAPLWEARKPARLCSGIWTQTGVSGKVHRLRAAAVCVESQTFLLIEAAEVLLSEARSSVEAANDAALANDKIANLSRALASACEQLAVQNQEVERATHAKSEFLARMSHEIRTPMNTILGMADLLADTPLNSEQSEYVRVFQRAGDNLLNLISDILDLSKVDSGEMELEHADFDLCDVLEKACEIGAIRAHAKGLELSGRIMPDVPTLLRGDAGRLRQILWNLLGNSIKFTDHGELTVLVELDPDRKEDGALRFAIRDTGIGIAPDKLGAIFENFTQADGSITRKYGGTGLGLAISRKFAELMGGRMWVESALGAGSAFFFTGFFQVRGLRAAPPDEFAGLRCLLVDGNANHRAALADILTSWGAVVDESDGPTLLAKLHAGSLSPNVYAMALLDAQIPGADSFQVAAAIRANLKSSTQVLMMTATGRPADAARCRELGLRTLLRPVRRSELIEVWRSGGPEGPASPPGGAGISTGRAPAAPDIGLTRILLADDSHANRFLIRAYLRDSGCVLDEAADGLLAVEKFKAGTYHLVLTDVEMPVLDGYSATRQMRAWERETGRSPTPILALTAHAFKKETQKSLDAGCNALLTKPIQKLVLLEAIRQHVPPVESGSKRVVVDSSLEELIPGYLANRRADVLTLRAALDSADFQAIRMIAHKIRGSGGGYGFPVLTELGAAIEGAALAQDSEVIRKNLTELDLYLAKVEVTYE